MDASGNLFVADSENNAVYELPASTSYSTVIPLGGGYTFGGPQSVAVDASGNLYVVQQSGALVVKIWAAGGYTNVTAVGGYLPMPNWIATDGSGNVYVTDGETYLVWEVMAAANLGSVNVGSHSATIPLTFTFAADTTVGNYSVLTQGQPGMDFADTGDGNCAVGDYNRQDSCTIDIRFIIELKVALSCKIETLISLESGVIPWRETTT